jgi:hypothetical protein
MSVQYCNKKREDDNVTLFGLFLLSQAGTASFAISAGDPTFEQISASAGTPLTYKLSWPSTSSSVRSTSSSVSTKCTVTLYDEISKIVKRRVESLPGESQIELSYQPSVAEILSLVTACNGSVSGTSTVSGATRRNSPETFSRKYGSSATKNIVIAAGVTNGGIFFGNIWEISSSTSEATILTGGTFTVKINDVTKTYTYNNNATAALKGYSDPSFTAHTTVVAGNTITLSLSYPSKSIDLRDITIPGIPNVLSSVSINGIKIGYNSNTKISISKSKSFKISWDLPASNVPNYGGLKFGLNPNDYISNSEANTANQNGIRQLIMVDLSKGSVTFPGNVFSQLTVGGANDCAGFDPSFIFNSVFLEGFYPGDYTDHLSRKQEGFGGAFLGSSAFRTTNPYDKSAGLPFACESGKVFSGSQQGFPNYNWATSDAQLTITD